MENPAILSAERRGGGEPGYSVRGEERGWRTALICPLRGEERRGEEIPHLPCDVPIAFFTAANVGSMIVA